MQKFRSSCEDDGSLLAGCVAPKMCSSSSSVRKNSDEAELARNPFSNTCERIFFQSVLGAIAIFTSRCTAVASVTTTPIMDDVEHIENSAWGLSEFQNLLLPWVNTTYKDVVDVCRNLC